MTNTAAAIEPKAETANPELGKVKTGKDPKSISALVDSLYWGVAEQTVNESAWWSESQLRPYNPDDLVQKHQDYRIYEDMLNDDQVSVCMTIKKDLVIGSGFEFQLDETGPQHEEIQRDLSVAFDEDCEDFEDDLEQLIHSVYSKGFALSEKLFQHRPDGTLTFKTLKTRHPATWLIHTDERGNVERYEQRGRSENITVDPKSLIHMVNSKRYGNVYGRSDLRAAYNAWFIKRQIVRYYAMYLEGAAKPIPVARYPQNTPEDKVEDLHNAVKKFQARTSLTLPKEIEVEFLEAKSNGEAYEKAINIFNMFIGRALMIPDLLGFQGSETGGGSYALGKDQIGMLVKHIMRRRRSLERVVNRHLVKPIVVYNHGFVDRHPKFKLKPIDNEQLLALVKLWGEIVRGKLYKPSEEEINHFRRAVEFPEGPVEYPEPVAMPGEDGNGGDNPEDDNGKAGPGTNGDKQQSKGGKGSGAKDRADDGDETSAPAPAKKTENAAPAAKIYKALTGEYDKKCDYKAIETQMDRFKTTVTNEALPVVTKIYEDLYDQLASKRIIQLQAIDKIDALKVKFLKELKLVVTRNLREGFKEGIASGRAELTKGITFRSPIPDDKFLEWLESETFQYIGDWEYKVKQKARLAAMQAIKDGRPLSSVIDMLDEEGKQDAMVSLERYARTKYTEVMNKGRRNFFNESGVVAAYQYSAILDDRTTEICEGLHGKVFKAGDEPVPPMHFNCRSLLIPITKYEAWEADEEVDGVPIDKFIDENKGSGFSKE